MVRVERCGKSAPDDAEVFIAANSIRSNTAEETSGLPVRFREGGLTVPATVWLDR